MAAVERFTHFFGKDSPFDSCGDDTYTLSLLIVTNVKCIIRTFI